LVHQQKIAGTKIQAKQNANGYNSSSFGNIGKQTAFASWKAMAGVGKGKLLPGVFLIAVMRLPTFCVRPIASVVPCASCLHSKWIEDVSAGQFGILVHLVHPVPLIHA